MERLRRGGTIGMDLDRGAIKAVQLARTADGYVLQHVGYQRLPEGAIIDGEVADSEMLAAEIRTFWDLHSFRGKSVVLGVAGRNVIVRFIDFPRLSPEDLDSAMNFQAEEHIPMPLEDSILDHIVLGPSYENPEEDRVLVVAAHRAMITGYTSTTRSGGLRPTGIDVKALSLTRSALPDVLFDNEETVLLLDIGTEISNLVIVQNRMPTLTQFIPLGFRDFADSVAQSADLDADTAEKQALNPRANIGVYFDEGDEQSAPNSLEATIEAETLPIEPSKPEDEGATQTTNAGADQDDRKIGDEDPTGELDPEAISEEETSEDEETENEAPRNSEAREDDSMGEQAADGDGEESEDSPEDEPGQQVDDLEARNQGLPETESENGESENGESENGESENGESENGESENGESENGESENGESENGESENGFPGSEVEVGGEDEVSEDEERTEELNLDPALMYDVRRGLEDAAGRLAEEVQRSVEYHNSRPEAREVSRILVSGEGSLVRGLESYLGDLLGVAAERARPTGKLTANRSNISDEQLAAMEPVLAIALGLAMEDE